LRKLREGEVIVFSDQLSARVAERGETDLRLEFNLAGEDFDAALAEAGAMPLPPYIAAKRAPDAQDKTDYQTVFARHSGAVAAPTASLHFEPWLLQALAAKGVSFTEVTLHVGAGTFLPVKVEDVTTHRMHAEWGQVTAQAAAEINATRASRRPGDPGRHHGAAADRDGGAVGAGATLARADRHLHLPRLPVSRHRCADDQLPPAEIDAADAGFGADGQGPDRPHLCPCDSIRLPFLLVWRCVAADSLGQAHGLVHPQGGLSGLIVAAVAEIARRSPGFAALVASLPLVSILGMIWMWQGGLPAERIASHAEGTFWYVLPSLPMFLAMPWLMRSGFGFWASLLAGCGLTVLLYVLMLWIGPRFGLKL
jgi:hypothetical protein